VRYVMVWPSITRTAIRGSGFYLLAGRSTKTPEHTWGQPGRDLGMHGFLLLVNGSGTYRDGEGRRETVVAGDLFQLFPGLPHDYGPGPGERWEEAFIDGDGDLLRLLAAQGLLDRRHPLLHPPADAIAPLRRLIDDVEACQLSDPREAQWRLHSAVLALARWNRGAEDAALEAGRRVLAADPHLPLDPRAAADAAGLGWELFRKRFRARYGLPPARYRLHARCEAAAQTLVTGPATVEDVACSFGFCDGAHLRRHFRSVQGMSPEAYRRLYGRAPPQ
jgi:AraC-like DNA-binding protein